ncbi:hypothetical protein B0H14DRAFT_2626159 [Mycena olivaceomarginata]|nr:hypothetical protein B0H14DRAFT_2626159 [Mycena olivaceomarginata]
MWIATRSSSSSAPSCAPHLKPAKPSRKRRATKPSVPLHGGLELRFYQGFLEQLQVVPPRICQCLPDAPIVAKDSKDFAARVAACVTASATDDLASGSTLQRFMDTDPPRGRQFSVALMCTSQRNPVGRTAEEVRADPLHAWLLFIHHAPEGTQGKSYLFRDSGIRELLARVDEQEVSQLAPPPDLAESSVGRQRSGAASMRPAHHRVSGVTGGWGVGDEARKADTAVACRMC